MNDSSVQKKRLVAAAMLSLAAATAQAASIGDVFVIALENHNFTQPSSYTATQAIQGNSAAPFINSLITPGNANASNVSYATNYTNSGTGVHPSEPNYIWGEAGTNYNPATGTTVLSDNDPSSGSGNIFTTPHLTGLMNAAGVSWKSYQEDYQISGSGAGVSASGTLPGGATNPYNGSTVYAYAPKHDPMVFFSDTATEKLAPISQLSTDLTNNTVGRYNWITPDLYNDMHTALSAGFTYHGVHYTGDQAGVAQGDNFLSIVVPLIEASSAYKNNGAIIIWNDETEGGDTTATTATEIVISPLARGNAFASSVPLNHSSDLRTMQEIFGLGPTYLNNTIPSGEYSPATGTGTVNSVGTVNDLSSLFQTGVITPLPVIWTVGAGTWSTASKWLGGIVPSASNVEVQIPIAPANAVVTLDVSESVADVILGSTSSLTISTGKTLTLNGPATTTLNGTTTTSGTLVASNVSIGSTGNFRLPAGGALVSKTFTNQGTTSLTGSQNWSSGATFNNTGGSATFASDSSALGGANLTVNLTGGAVTFSSTQHLAGLNIGSGTTASVTGGSAGIRSILLTPSLTNSGALDLTTNGLDLQNGAAAGLTAITALIRQGYNNGLWNGGGITSSAAASDSTHLSAIGVVLNGQNGAVIFSSSHPFEGITPASTDVLARFTYVGDANLDGLVDGSDFTLIDNGFNNHLTGWLNGDFNYDGVVDGSDYTLIDNAFNTQGSQLAAETAAATSQLTGLGATSVVPEPATVTLVGIGSLVVLARRRVRRA